MHTHEEKKQENKIQPLANAQKRSGGDSTFQLVDNRPEAIAQRRLQERANNSPQTKRLRAIRERSNNSPQAKQAAQLQAMANKRADEQMFAQGDKPKENKSKAVANPVALKKSACERGFRFVDNRVEPALQKKMTAVGVLKAPLRRRIELGRVRGQNVGKLIGLNSIVQRTIGTHVRSSKADMMDGVKTMTAVIGSSALWDGGTKPTTGEPIRIKSVGPIDGRYVGGHMLNQTVGGRGRWYNMIVQSETSNKGMNKHDNIIKNLGTIARRLEEFGPRDWEYAVMETITVKDPRPSGSVDYPGERKVPSSIEVNLRPFKRIVGQTLELPWDDHKQTITNPYIVPNVPPYPGVGAPRRQGRQQRQIERAKLSRERAVGLKRLRGRKACGLSVEELQYVPGIGPAKANAIRQHLGGQGSLATLQTANLGGLGFVLNDVNTLLYHGLT